MIRRYDRGSSLMLLLPLLLVLVAAGVTTFQYTGSGLRFASKAGGRHKSFYIADGGLRTAMTRLYADRATASASTTYTATGTGALGPGSFTYAIVQDPAYTSDPTRKQVTATGTAAHTTTSLVQQVQVFPFDVPSGGSTPGANNPTCDLTILADTGTAGVTTLASDGALLGTNASAASVHGNNTLTLSATVGAVIDSYGKFESVADTIENRIGPVGVAALSNTHVNLYRGGGITFPSQFPPYDFHAILTGTPLMGIHFLNGSSQHGAQQTVASIRFPSPDWRKLEQTATTIIVDGTNLPFGSWNDGTKTWSQTGTQIVPPGNYFVRGNVNFANITLARNENVTIAATGWIEVDELTLLQVNVGSYLAVGLNGMQTLRLIGKGNVYLGRGNTQSEAAALIDVTRHGMSLTANVTMQTRVAGYSENADVWVKASNVDALAGPKLNLVGKVNAVYAVTSATVSPATTYCQSST